MDDSQSSDFFSETGRSMYDVSTIDEESYQTLFNKIKKSIVEKNTIKNIRSEDKCKILLSDCRNCTDQSFNIILSLLEDSDIHIDKVCSYIENVVEILQILSNFIKIVIETVPLTGFTVTAFPTCTGTIIELVFSHCKDSEFIYENHLSLVEKQLKDLFRSCHELQLTYLMTLQKHFLFDLTIKEEQETLLEALDINLKIGEIVQSLDVKTMAEQWKAYIVLCEKYTAFLLDKNTYNNCTKLLTSTVYKNITTVMEADEKDKIIVRSLKVASFSLKILMKISLIFKGATNIDYDYIIQLLCTIKLCDSNYHELISNKSSQLSSLMHGHLSRLSEAFVLQLVHEEKFLKSILLVNTSDNKDSKLLGYLLILISIMKAVVKSEKNATGVENKLLDRLYSVIQKCHIWFNIGLKFTCPTNSGAFYGLYEYLLVNTTAFISTMMPEEYFQVEKLLIESILSPDVYSSIFSANLWLLLCRMGSNHLHINTLNNLIKTYQVLEAHTTIYLSPQEIHLKNIIEKLFSALKDNDKIAIYKKYNLQEDKNIGVWCALKISNLPENLEIVGEKTVVDKLLEKFRDVSEIEKNMDILVKYLQLAATCTFVEHYPELEDLVTTVWGKFCISCKEYASQKCANMNSAGHFVLLKTLTLLTKQYGNKFYKSTNVLKILNVMSKILQLKNTELTVIIFETFCELLYHSEYDNNLEALSTNTFRSIAIECDIRRQIFTILITNKEIHDFILPILHNNPSVDEIKNLFEAYKEEHRDIAKWREQLELASDYDFRHKCMENKISELNPNCNFDINFECLFEDEEPASKRAKIDTNVESVITALEQNTIQLNEMKEIVLCNEYKERLRNVCEKIRNIVS